MEAELIDLREIVNSRTVVTIVDEHLHWRSVRAIASGTRIRYVLGTESNGEVKDLAKQIEFMQKEMDRMHAEHATAIYKKHEEIKALNRVTWYQKLLGKK
jgi:hypothetical protein